MSVVMLIVSNFLTFLLIETSGQQQTSEHDGNGNAPPANSGRDLMSTTRTKLNSLYESFKPKHAL